MARKKQLPIKTQKGQGVPELSEGEAREHIEKLMWPDGQPVCRHCGSVNAYKMQGTTCRPGLCRCRDCKKQFTVTVGTIFEDSHIPLAKWIKAFHLLATSKKGFSALQLMRNLGLGSYRTAWFMFHRVREAMRFEPMAGMLKGTVEVDETFVGGRPRKEFPGQTFKRGRGTKKAIVQVLVERGGNAYSTPIPNLTGNVVKGPIRHGVDPSATIMTDENPSYKGIGAEFAGGHGVVKHNIGEYANGDISTNQAESFFALLKRGHYGVYHKMSKKHLHRYSTEFNFRWNGRKMTDVERRDLAVAGAEGKRLTYKPIVNGN
jgi:transposase-like protein